MVLLPAPAGPSMAMINLRGEWSFILRVDDCTRRIRWTRDGLFGCAARPDGRDNWFFRRSDLEHRSSAAVNEAQFAGRQQCVYSLFHAAASHEVSKEGFEFGLFGGDHAVQIF